MRISDWSSDVCSSDLGVGFAGVKGFVGGFGRGELGAFGESAIKGFVEESINEARKLENALRSLRTERTVAVLHYAPDRKSVVWGKSGSVRVDDGCRRSSEKSKGR